MSSSRRARSITRSILSSVSRLRPYPLLHSTSVVPALIMHPSRCWKELNSSSSEAWRVRSTVKLIPPPAWWISMYVAPANWTHGSPLGLQNAGRLQAALQNLRTGVIFDMTDNRYGTGTNRSGRMVGHHPSGSPYSARVVGSCRGQRCFRKGLGWQKWEMWGGLGASG